MQIKEAILNNEKELVKEFLNKFDLKYADDIVPIILFSSSK